jgi:hypothetical protein
MQVHVPCAGPDARAALLPVAGSARTAPRRRLALHPAMFAQTSHLFSTWYLERRPMTLREKCRNDALFLLEEFSEKKATFYDEGESAVHTIDQGVIELATEFADYTSYFVSVQDGDLSVRKETIDPKAGGVGQALMDEDDYAEVEKLLDQLAGGVRSQITLKEVDIKAAARSLLDALFSHGDLGPKPARAPSLTKNSSEIGQAVNALLRRSRRQAGFEWKEWAEIGVRAVNKLPSLKALGITIAIRRMLKSAA